MQQKIAVSTLTEPQTEGLSRQWTRNGDPGSGEGRQYPTSNRFRGGRRASGQIGTLLTACDMARLTCLYSGVCLFQIRVR
jgi:hypothetical protein